MAKSGVVNLLLDCRQSVILSLFVYTYVCYGLLYKYSKLKQRNLCKALVKNIVGVCMPLT